MNSDQYYTRHGRKIQGPFDIDRLRRLASLGRFSRSHQISTDRVSWYPATELTEIFGEPQPTSRQTGAQPATAVVEMEFPGDSRTRGNYLALWIGIPVALIFLVMAGGGIWLFLAVNKSDRSADRSADLSSGQMIVGMDNDEHFIDAIGFVVSGNRYTTKNGVILEKVLSVGSCFMVSPSGYALTNKHVVESYLQLKRAKDKLRTERDKGGFEDVEPIVLTFFGGRSYPAEIVYVSDEYDMAILKFERRNSAYFTLSDSNTERRSQVLVCGFPAAVIDKSALNRKFMKAITSGKDARMKRYFSEADFQYSSTKGAVSRVIKQEDGNGEVIQHDASINPGNSGGPLVSAKGVVYGINTWRIKNSQGIFLSLTLRQLRKEIDEHVPNAVWK